MKCTILTIGTEILFGSIVNTNAVFLSQQLQEIGIDVMYHMTVGDNTRRLKETLDHAYEDCDLIITTGGLGPTQDDLTKETICEYFGVVNKEQPGQMDIIRETFKKMGRPCTENNLKQAYFPDEAVILPNPMGTAPGMYLEKDGKIAILMPGPPRENIPMFTDYVRPMLEKFADSRLYYKTVRTFDIGESVLETKLLSLIDGQTDPTLATYAKTYEATLRVASKRKTLEEAQAAVEDMLVKVHEIIGENIYSEDDEELDDVVAKLLLEKQISISSAESMTGGLFAKTLTDKSGISSVFNRGIVTYTNEAKMDELGVQAETLDKYTAVSPQVAEEMVKGLYKVTGTRVCVAVTGYASGGEGVDPSDVGLYFIGLCVDGNAQVFRFKAPARGREYVRNHALRQMFLAIYKEIVK